MRIGLLSGTATYAWPGLADHTSRTVTTGFGNVELSEGRVAGVEVVHLCRHGPGHARLSNQVNHRANLAALMALEVDAVIAMTVCGAVAPAIRLGSVVVFDDLFFPANRLPDGSACTWHQNPGQPGRGHWIFDQPFSDPLRQALIQAAAATATPCRPAGCYGHVDGPRFNSCTEIAALAAVGVAAVSQTLGPEVVLAGEAELPIAALGYVTDYANGVSTDAEPLDGLAARLQQAPRTFAAVIAAALPAVEKPTPAGSVWRFD
jgi:5'-methylthioadenosine phosphorylase